LKAQVPATVANNAAISSGTAMDSACTILAKRTLENR
jgi:hypothetical protein